MENVFECVAGSLINMHIMQLNCFVMNGCLSVDTWYTLLLTGREIKASNVKCVTIKHTYVMIWKLCMRCASRAPNDPTYILHFSCFNFYFIHFQIEFDHFFCFLCNTHVYNVYSCAQTNNKIVQYVWIMVRNQPSKRFYIKTYCLLCILYLCFVFSV